MPTRRCSGPRNGRRAWPLNDRGGRAPTIRGWARTHFDAILVDRRTGDRPRTQRARLRRLFSPTSSRIARALLEQPAASWTLAGLAQEVGVSLRTAHLVVNALEEQALVEKARGAIRLRQPGQLLDLWAGEYGLEQHQRRAFFSFVRNPRELARLLPARATARKERVALTLHAGAQLFAPVVRSPEVHAYVLGDVESLAREVDLRPAEAGAGSSGLQHFRRRALRCASPGSQSVAGRLDRCLADPWATCGAPRLSPILPVNGNHATKTWPSRIRAQYPPLPAGGERRALWPV